MTQVLHFSKNDKYSKFRVEDHLNNYTLHISQTISSWCFVHVGLGHTGDMKYFLYIIHFIFLEIITRNK